nr:glutathione S-transferase 1-like [Ciona intestinalis]|eukprot:XP_002128278.1 glutathione S-transferase 1-like [Ciona intestinalis]
MPSYKLSYFNGRGRAELIRIMFAEAGVKFVDDRITDNWPKRKAEFPFGQLPVLEIDGTQLSQTAAIVGYLAKKFNFLSEDDLTNGKVQEIIGIFGDCFAKLPFFEKDEKKKAAAVAEQVNTKIIPAFTKIQEKFVPDCSSTLLGEFTVADMALLTVVDSINDFDKTVFENFPKLKKVYNDTCARPKIAAYLKTRPETPF